MENTYTHLGEYQEPPKSFMKIQTIRHTIKVFVALWACMRCLHASMGFVALMELLQSLVSGLECVMLEGKSMSDLLVINKHL